MIVHTLSVGLLQTNCYIVVDETECMVLDPGGGAERILELTSQIRVRYVVNTHAHFDHTAGNRKLLNALQDRPGKSPELVTHPDAISLLADEGGAGWFGFPPILSPEPDRLVQDGDVLQLGQLAVQVLHTPGHSPGSISLYVPREKALFVGDTLFRQGIGRPDLPGGDGDVLLRVIRDRLLSLPDDTTVYPGHGPATSIGYERMHNPYLS